MNPHLRPFRFLIMLALFLSLGITLVNAQDEPYRNPDLPVADRVADLLARMTLDEKIGQMTLVEKNSLSPANVTQYAIGGVLSGGGGYPSNGNSVETWARMTTDFQQGALDSRLGIPMIYGVDAIHGHNNLRGATIFPQSVGLGATRDADLVEQIGRATAQEMIATGIYWDYAPVIAVPQDIRWGRSYEAYGENTDLVTELGTAFIHGLQGDDLAAPDTVLATPKHFIGDGGTAWGTSPFGPRNLDRGVTEVDEATLRALFLPPYQAAIDAGAQNIMISYSSWGGLRMHAQKYLITDVLEGELGFDGFIVSDWAGMDDAAPTYYDAMVTSVNAGVDMNMVPQDYRRFITTMQQAVANGDVSEERIDDAVSRILKVKFELGLFEHPFADPALAATVGSDEHRALARQAVAESQVLLKNDAQTLPLAKDAPLILIAGSAADDIGIQSGGWTIEWQGQAGDITPGTTIRQAIENTVADGAEVKFNRAGNFNDLSGTADVGIVVVGERPYAEYEGDSATLALAATDLATIRRVRALADKLILVVVSGRPVVIDELLPYADAVVAAWLPGTEGQGVADVLFGDQPFTGKLPYTWLRTVDQLPFDFANLPTDSCDAPLFPYGYGLTTEDSSSPYLDLAAECAPAVEVAAQPTLPPAVITADATPAPAAAEPAVALAPDGVYGETYNAPFPVSITLDGSFSDWAGVPRVTVPQNADLSSTNPSVTFAAAADDQNLYFFASVVDDNIISGEHDADYWNEDSVEFYVNATGDLTLTSYKAGVAQITIPAMDVDLPADQAVISGMQSASANATVAGSHTANGYAVEVAVPLHTDVWDITPADGGEIGFQVHLNGASTADRDAKLIWSKADTSDSSYQDPSVFGKLIFTAVSAAKTTAPDHFASHLSADGMIDDFERGIWMGVDPYNAGIGFVPWGDTFENVSLALRLLPPKSALAIPGTEAAPNTVLAAIYNIGSWGGFTHAFTDGFNWVSQDWTAYDGISFWLYGNDTGGVVQLDLFDNRNPDQQGDTAERWYYRLTDDYTGWQQFTIPFDQFQRRTDFQPSGAPDDGLGLNEVSGYAFGFPVGVGTQIAYLDDVRLVKTGAPEVSVVQPTPQPTEVPVTVDNSVTWDSREWNLVWSDEFDGDAGTPINSENWTAEIGGAGWGNNEREYYTARPENASMDGAGNLAIVARQENPGEYHCHYGTCEYTSARLISRDKVEFTYGRVEARIQIPRGQGIWPAFWMLGNDISSAGWPQSGEIDIMENIGKEPQIVHGTIHGPGYSGANGIGAPYTSDTDFADDFHVYAVDWDPDVIRWYVDGNLYNTLSRNDIHGNDWVFDHDFFILLNVAVGGGWPGYPDETTVFPQTMLVDYVRVYQLADGS